MATQNQPGEPDIGPAAEQVSGKAATPIFTAINTKRHQRWPTVWAVDRGLGVDLQRRAGMGVPRAAGFPGALAKVLCGHRSARVRCRGGQIRRRSQIPPYGRHRVTGAPAAQRRQRRRGPDGIGVLALVPVGAGHHVDWQAFGLDCSMDENG